VAVLTILPIVLPASRRPTPGAAGPRTVDPDRPSLVSDRPRGRGGDAPAPAVTLPSATRRWPATIRLAASALPLLLVLAALSACDAATLRAINERAAAEGTAGPPRNRTGDNSSS
jgi:hypothetical protein